MKDWIEEHYPKVHNSYVKLKKVVQEAWEAITHERIEEIVREMPQRCTVKQ